MDKLKVEFRLLGQKFDIIDGQSLGGSGLIVIKGSPVQFVGNRYDRMLGNP